MTTLTTLRTGTLNVDLGLTSDHDNRFGTSAVRNLALSDAIRRMWPRMARLTSEGAVIGSAAWHLDAGLTLDSGLVLDATTQTAIGLTTVRDVHKVERFDLAGTWIRDIADFTTISEDDGAGSVTTVVHLAYVPATSDVIVVYGWTPYTVPATATATLDLLSDQEWIVVAGARAWLYRRQLNQFAVFERFQNENRRAALSPEQLLTMARDAEALYESGLTQNARRQSMPRRAIRVRR